jgi:hypothetical protein
MLDRQNLASGNVAHLGCAVNTKLRRTFLKFNHGNKALLGHLLSGELSARRDRNGQVIRQKGFERAGRAI